MRTPIVILAAVALLVVGVDMFLWFDVTTLSSGCGLCALVPFIAFVATYPLLGCMATMSAGTLALIHAIRARSAIWIVILALLLPVSAASQYWVVVYALGRWFGVFYLARASDAASISTITLPSTLLLAALALVSARWGGRGRTAPIAQPGSAR